MRKKERKHFKFRCLGPNLNEQKLVRLQKELEGEEFLKNLQILKVLCGSSRFKVLYLLAKQKELCVCDLADIMKTTLSSVSHQLRVLKEHGIVDSRREGKTIFYSLKSNWQQKFKRLFL